LALINAFVLSLMLVPKVFGLWLTLGRNAGGKKLRHFFYVMEACWLKRFCQRNHITHLHTHFGTNSATVALFCRVLGGPAYSFTVHGPEEFDFPVVLSLKEKIHAAKFVVAITSYCKSQLCRWAHFEDWEKIVEVHCAIDDSVLNAQPANELAAQRFVSIGRLCEQKGQMLLLEAVRILRNDYPAIVLHLVGDGEFRAVFERYIQTHNLEKNIFICGWMTGAQIITELDAARAMVLPSFAEGLPVVIMEAFARQRPVVTTYIAGIPELVTPKNGWLVPAGNVEALIAAMRAVIETDNTTLWVMGNDGFNAVKERHNAPIEAQTLLDAISRTSSC
jgi:glycosyltransferase involved in cell wall biosynthesis